MPGGKDVGPVAEGLVLFPWEEQGLCDWLETKQGLLDNVTGQLPGLGGGTSYLRLFSVPKGGAGEGWDFI